MISIGNFTFTQTFLEGVIIVESKVFGDDRGFFMEYYHQEHFHSGGIKDVFIQDNHSKSSKGVIRGLHYQTVHQQAKLIRVIKGEIFDVCVDIRKESTTYGKWFGILLSENNKKQVFIPQGFAHGFLTLSEEAEINYKCSELYVPEEEAGIIWNDPKINIEWPLENIEKVILSLKDKKLGSLYDK